MRASLLGRAVAALLWPSLRSSRSAHARRRSRFFMRLACQRTEVQGADHLPGHRLDRHRADLLVAEGLEQSVHVRSVRLVSHHVGPDVLRRQQDDDVTEFLDSSRPVVGRAAGLHHHRRLGKLREELEELVARQSPARHYTAWFDPTRRPRRLPLRCRPQPEYRSARWAPPSSCSKERLWQIDADSVAGGVHLINAADEARLEARGNILVGKTIAREGTVVRPSQPIASVRRLQGEEGGA
jgi:hypothetical protein